MGYTSAVFGPGSYAIPIHLDDVACRGSEMNLLDCPGRPIGQQNCAHSEDASVDCLGRSPGKQVVHLSGSTCNVDLRDVTILVIGYRP